MHRNILKIYLHTNYGYYSGHYGRLFPVFVHSYIFQVTMHIHTQIRQFLQEFGEIDRTLILTIQ